MTRMRSVSSLQGSPGSTEPRRGPARRRQTRPRGVSPTELLEVESTSPRPPEL